MHFKASLLLICFIIQSFGPSAGLVNWNTTTFQGSLDLVIAKIWLKVRVWAAGVCVRFGMGKFHFSFPLPLVNNSNKSSIFSQWATKDEQSSFKKHCSYTISRLDLLKKRCENWYGKEIWEEIPLGITRRSGMYFLQYMKHPAKKIQMFSYVNTWLQFQG